MTWFSKNAKLSLLLSLCLFLLGCAHKGPPAKYGPIIQFTREHLDLGVVKQGETPRGQFSLQNIGDETLIIKGIKPSCGCTAAMMESQEIPPGREGKIQVVVDTTGKELDIDKTIIVTSNDSLRPEIVLSLSLVVEPSAHPDFDMGVSLFSPRCASCHADSGKGLQGKALYEAICYQCHGEKGEGKTASALNTRQYLEEKSDDYLFNWIADGQQGTAMAGYLREKGGPLSREQINSLVKFMHQLPLQKEER